MDLRNFTSLLDQLKQSEEIESDSTTSPTSTWMADKVTNQQLAKVNKMNDLRRSSKQQNNQDQSADGGTSD